MCKFVVTTFRCVLPSLGLAVAMTVYTKELTVKPQWQ